MTDHFTRNYDTFNEIFLDKVINGGSLMEEIRFLKTTARKYIDRASVANKANVALNLNNAWRLMPAALTENHETMGVLQQVERQLYDVVHDDLFIVAAFENYAKATLLSKRYVVHTIRKPNSLRIEQKDKPIHINTIRSKRHLPTLWFEHHTIGINHLLKPEYVCHLGISDRAKYAINKCRTIRNQIHFGGPKVVGYGSGLYEGLLDLREVIYS